MTNEQSPCWETFRFAFSILYLIDTITTTFLFCYFFLCEFTLRRGKLIFLNQPASISELVGDQAFRPMQRSNLMLVF